MCDDRRMISLTFIGAAQTVTGSKHLLTTSRARVLLDCGLFQGRRREARERNADLGVPDVAGLDAVVLSHAHIDHSGALPVLAKHGYRGEIFATAATKDLCGAMLEDAAMIQAADARTIQRAIERDGSDMEPVEPLYTKEDVAQILSQMNAVAYHHKQTIAPGIELTFLDAGHVLGSAISILDIEDGGERRRLVFTGDLGRKNVPILRDPEIATGADWIMIESTYGDRDHDPIAAMDDALADLVTRVAKRGGKLIIPSFALERAQEIIFSFQRLQRAGRMPKIPVYVDSPLTVKLTDVFRRHPECYDDEMRALFARDATSPFAFDALAYVSEKEDSKAIDQSEDACVIISASGMCEAGRILHHLKAALGSAKNAVAIVGFQAPHTLGRRLVERRSSVKIFGMSYDVNAEVVVLNGFSAHAGQSELLSYLQAVEAASPALEKIVLVHGEPKAQGVLARKLLPQTRAAIVAPGPGEVLPLAGPGR